MFALVLSRHVPLSQIDNIRYVPLVGKMTVAMLERNLLRLYENFHRGATGVGGGGSFGVKGGNGTTAMGDPIYNRFVELTR